MKHFLTLPFLLLTVLCFGQKGKHKHKINNEETIFSFGPVPISQMYWRKPQSNSLAIYPDSTNLYIVNGVRTIMHQGYVFMGVPQEVMSISAPDSTKTVTVKFNRKLVHFINDSTFIFKQQ